MQETDKRINRSLTKKEKGNLLKENQIEKKYIRWKEQAFKKWRKHIKIYTKFSTAIFKNDYKWVGEYVSGTYKHPLIFLFLDMIKFDSRLDDGETLEANYKITIYHELGHALCEYQRKMGLKLISEKKEEDFVERLARTIHYNTPLPAEAILMDQVLCLIENNKLKDKVELLEKKVRRRNNLRLS